MATPSVHKIPQQIELALKKAADETGVDFQYLVDTAARESGFRATVKARTSSATGLFQFIESTWLQMVKDKGSEFGLGHYAAQIKKTSDGRYLVNDAKMRREILDLRKNAETASLMAGAFTKINSEELTARVGRKPTQGELYIAHFLGAGNGGKLIKAASVNPTMRADALFPSAARANKPLFYKSGNALSVKQLYQNLVRRHQMHSITIAEAPKKVDANLAEKVIQTAGLPEVLQGAVLTTGRAGLTDNGVQLQQAQTIRQVAEVTPTKVIDDKGHAGLGVWQVFRADQVREAPVVRPLLANLDDRDGVSPRPILDTGRDVKGLFRKGGLGRLSNLIKSG